MTNGVTSRRTFRAVLGRALRGKLVVLALLAGWFGGQELAATVFSDLRQDGGTGSVTRPPAPGSPGDLVERHDCWTGAAPHDVDMPGHVVVTTPNGTARYAGPRMVGLALDQVFAGADNGLTVHAFCR